MKRNIYRITIFLMFALMIYFVVGSAFVGSGFWSQFKVFIYLGLAVLFGLIGYKLAGKGWDEWGRRLWLVLLLLGLIFSGAILVLRW